MEQAQAQPKRGIMPLWEGVDLLRKISLFPALTVMIFLRHHLGFRMLKPNWLTVMAGIMIVSALMFQALSGPVVWALPLYALAMLGWGHWQRWQRWCDICNGVRWHSYSPGIAYLQYLPWPMFMQSHSRVTRYVEPAVVLVVGLLMLLVSRLLGLWLELAALFLFVYEQQLYEMMLNRSLDTLDGLIAAEVQEQNVKHFQQAQPEDKVRSITETAGIPTGIAPDIDRLLAQRQAEFDAAHPAPKGPDNLATDTPPAVAPVTPAGPMTPLPDAPPSQAPPAPDNLAPETPPSQTPPTPAPDNLAPEEPPAGGA